MNDVRNILLIGRTGGGKSTLANVLTGTNNFIESSRTVSQTKSIEEGVVEIDISRDGSEKIKYRIIDTIGIGDTQLTPQGVLTRLAEMAGRVKREGLNHILFVTKGRFSKEEVEAYDLLSSIIFDHNVLNYTTIVRTGFPEFEDREACDDDRAALRIENADLVHILGSVNIIYVDNPPLKGRPRAVEEAKETREESHKRLLTYLGTCQGNYRPSNIDTLEERVQDYKTNEQKLKDKMKELEESRKQQEEEFRKKISELKEEQAKELRENRVKFEEDIRKVKVEGDENLRKTKTELEEKRRRDMEDLESRNRQQLTNLQESHRREAESIRASVEQQRQAIQAQMQQTQQENERLRRELEAKGNSSNAELVALLAQIQLDSKKQEEWMQAQRWEYQQSREELEEKRAKADEAAQKRFDIEMAAKKEAQDREFKHQQEIDRREQERKDKEVAEKIAREKEESERKDKQRAYQREKDKPFLMREHGWREKYG